MVEMEYLRIHKHEYCGNWLFDGKDYYFHLQIGEMYFKKRGGAGDLFPTPVSGGGIPILMFSVN